MIYILLSVIVPIAVYLLLPLLVTAITHKPVQRNAILIAACLLYFISWYLPSPLIEGKNTSFTTHLVGGGIFSGFLWWYLKDQLHWKMNFLLQIVSLYAVVSSFGVANELFELAIVYLKLVKRLTLTDTSWDLFANTLGAILFFVAYTVARREKE